MFTHIFKNVKTLHILKRHSSSWFKNKHIGIKSNDMNDMLKKCNAFTIKELINQSLNIKNIDEKVLKTQMGLTEQKSIDSLKKILNKNINNTSLIGMGYYNTITPYPIARHVLENPKWYTAYTPYQAEISQGRLEAQYNYQTLITELTGLPVTNASLLDESSTSAEVLNMCKSKNKKNTFIVSDTLHPQILEVLKLKSNILGMDLIIKDFKEWNNSLNLVNNIENISGIMFQYPDTFGDIYIPHNIIKFAKENNIITTCSTDLLSLLKFNDPGTLGIDICFGSAQRFGVPLYYGGPHPAFLSCKKNFIRLMPGKMIGKSIDVKNNDCFRLSLQTREQHIKKTKATSNICTSQSLLASIVGFYGYYHGKEGLLNISNDVHIKTKVLDKYLSSLCLDNENKDYFDTLKFNTSHTNNIYDELLKKDIVIRKIDDNNFTISLDETTTLETLYIIINTIEKILHDKYRIELYDIYNLYNIYQEKNNNERNIDNILNNHFKYNKTETELLRYIYKLSKKDYTLCEGMIPLGSCTMKLNAAYQLLPLSWDNTKNFHPYLPKKYVQGYHELFDEIGNMLKDITDLNNVSFQSNSGAMGEYSGLLCIKKYHENNNNKHRNICLIPKSAHGTNFASAQLAGFKVEIFDDTLDYNEFKKIVKNKSEFLGAIMITFPGTNGIFQKDIKEICETIHDNGGLVYMDGANMNAQVGIISPGLCGADVCHLNLHKTFCIPHGGGGPGMGPILCNDKLKDYLPTNIIQFDSPNEKSIGMITSSNWSSASLLTIPYLYISAIGDEGLKQSTEIAILNANYLKDSLKDDYNIIDVNDYNRVAHEFIIDITNLKNKYNITETDIAKRLIDYSFHPPTMSWPRSNVLMFEPTESENKEELDRLIRALKSIKKEIEDIKDKDNNLLKNAPHSINSISDWNYPYTVDQAFFPLEELKENKHWPTINRVNDSHGDMIMLKK